MKKLSFLLAFLLISGVAFGEDTNLGNFSLTQKQIAQSESLKTDVIKGFCFWGDGKVVVTSTRELTKEEQTDLVASLKALPDEDTKEVTDAKAESEVDALVEKKLKDIAVVELKKEGKLDASGKLKAVI